MQVRVAHTVIAAGLVVRKRPGMRGIEVLVGIQAKLVQIGTVRLIVNENERHLILEGAGSVVVAVGVGAGHRDRH